MNRPVCQNCFFFGFNDKTCNYLLMTAQKRDCTPDNNHCDKKLTEKRAFERGYKKASEVLRTWIPPDEFKSVSEERKKIHNESVALRTLVFQGNRWTK